MLLDREGEAPTGLASSMARTVPRPPGAPSPTRGACASRMPPQSWSTAHGMEPDLGHPLMLSSWARPARSAGVRCERDRARRRGAAPGLGAERAHAMERAGLRRRLLAHRPRFVAVTEPEAARRMEQELRGTGVEVLAGPDGLIRMVQDPETDRVLSAIVGAAGPARDLGGAGGGQDRRPGEQGDAGRRRPAGHGPGPAAGGDDPAGRQRALGDLPGARGRASPRRCGG